MRIILASVSPRRKRLLAEFGIEFTVRPSNVDESTVEYSEPEKYVKELAELKAEDVAKQEKGALIIAADTIVVLDSNLIGKPKDNNEAKKILMKLSGQVHQVYTGVCVLDSSTCQKEIFVERTVVKFKELDETVIDSYIKNQNALDKAGGYNAEDKTSDIFIEYIKGSRTNVVGLP
ncbi:MAG: septum formation protein Maf, partial [Nanoarchaeota archaeon]|nr:septum formation protein Maf [Nanoarchaeota archaeon]